MMHFEIETDNGLFVASANTREEAVAKARAKAPGEQLIGTIIDEEGCEVGGFFVSKTPF
jgi:hypothetical protein